MTLTRRDHTRIDDETITEYLYWNKEKTGIFLLRTCVKTGDTWKSKMRAMTLVLPVYKIESHFYKEMEDSSREYIGTCSSKHPSEMNRIENAYIKPYMIKEGMR